MAYQGYTEKCGCRCKKCGGPTQLEGYSDPEGTHYCPKCDDFVGTKGICPEQTWEKIDTRQRIIERYGADLD